MDEKAFVELVREIASQGYNVGTATHYAVLIGDLPIKDAQGRIVVIENNRVLARLKPLKFFQTE